MGSEKKTILVKDARPVEVVIQPQCPVAPAYRVVATTYNNMVFRLFIWRDMFHEMWQQHPFGGFSFGKPQRSVSLEILDWAGHEWRRDGWITPHNSFLHYIYRGGVVGLGLIGVIVCVLFQMTEIFLQHRSWRGGLLVAALISWIVTAQFGVILELPYHAIPFWSLYGLTAAYCYHMSRTNGAES